MTTLGAAYLEHARRHLTACLERIEHCVGQLDEAQVWWRPDESLNAIGNLLLHLAGNLRQWVVSGVGGVPDARDRPAEFAERGSIARAELLARLRATIAEADAALARFDPTRLLETRRIQGYDLTAQQAIWDSLTHLSGHTQEIIYATRLQLRDRYRTFWAPATPEQGAAP